MNNLCHLWVWILAQLYKFVKRRLILVGFGSLTSFTIFTILLKWSFTCSNIQPEKYVKNICTDYHSGTSIGNLCDELCNPDGISSISCHNFHTSKEAVFSGIHGNHSVVFKLPRKISNYEVLHWLDNSSKKIYPSEVDFTNMIVTNVKLKFNIFLNHVDAKRMTYINYSLNSHHREIEMENVWNLLQDNEYLALLLYEKFDIFPHLEGSCGSLYAVQKLNTISRYWHLITLYDSKSEWVKRVKLSVMILDFLLRLDHALPEPLRICDIKMDHFGVTNDFKKIKYLDLDSVHPVSVTNKLTADGSDCKQHSDCDFKDCRSFCNLMTFKCQHGVANNNLQIVCEKIFLGWVLSGRVMVPGLLLGPRSPRVLIDVLELCANPDVESGTPRAPASKEIRDRLHKLLSHLSLS
ncbi:divergent protein kinase domain 1C [Cydia fagiglandana]|uniref:divergent protein kinase domain 1C n=1 Tax=Cydia fagiglandana TaxID=1458189 RepID=UPI002FEDFC48